MSLAPDVAREPAALVVAGVDKSFDGVPALRSVDLAVTRGRVHALLGGNGSGKSTLIKILAGVQPADNGTVTVHDRSFAATGELTPAGAAEAGLRFVHQDLGLLLDFTVAENLAMSAGYPVRHGRIAWRALRHWTREVLDRFEVDADPDDLVGDLRPATRTMVAVARALRSGLAGRGVLVLDEPTASLPDHEVGQLLEALRRRAASGDTVVYVSHRLSEVLEIADDVTVLRDGQHLLTTGADGVDERRLVELIAGRAVMLDAPAPQPVARGGERPVVRVTCLSAGAVRDVDLDVGPGEIVGVAGLVGAGKTSLVHALHGDLRLRAGTVEVAGTTWAATGRRTRMGGVRRAIRRSVGLVPEDRARDALLPDLPVLENLSISALRQYAGPGGLRHRRERRDATSLAKTYRVRLHSLDQPVVSLSGGNQQKVVIARSLRRRPAVLLLDEPTQGVDVGARAEIYDLLRGAARAGTALVVASSDADELCRLCHRVVVLRAGRVVAALAAPDLRPERVVQLAYQEEPPFDPTHPTSPGVSP